MNERISTVIVGGGHAGLTMSYFLSQFGREHVILERDLEQNLAKGDESFESFKKPWTIM